MKKQMILLIIVLSFIAALMQSANAVITDGLVSYYSFSTDCITDDIGSNTGYINDSGNNRIRNTEDGLVGNYCYFYDTTGAEFNHIDLGKMPNFQRNSTFPKDMTISMLIISNETDCTNNDCWFFDRRSSNADTSAWADSFYYEGFLFSIANSAQDGYSVYLRGSEPVNLYNGWQLVLVRINSSKADLFWNSSLWDTDNSIDNFYYPDNKWVLGVGLKTNLGYNLDGAIDEVGFWNRSLSDNEIMWLFSNYSSGINPIIHPDITPPTIITAINDTTLEIGATAEISALCQDDTDIANIYYANNMTYQLQNVSNTGIVSNPYNYSITALNNASVGSVVGNIFTCVDSSGNSAQSSLTFESTLPIEYPFYLNITYPINNSIINKANISGIVTHPNNLSNTYITCAGSSTTTDYNKVLGYWNFDENSGTTADDLSTNNNYATLLNGANWGTSKGTNGTGTSSLNLDGVNDYLQINQNVNIGIEANLSITAWIYPSNLASYHTIINKRYSVSGALNYFFATSGDKLYFQYTSNGIDSPDKTSTISLNLNEWNFVSVLFTNSKLIFLINGQNESFPITTSLGKGTANATIGKFVSSDSLYFYGKIDELALFNNTLSVSAANSIYQNGINNYLTATTTGACGEWINKGNNETFSFINSSLLSNGIYNINVNSQDIFGNITSKNIKFTLDASAPELTLNLPVLLSSYNQNGISINVSASDSMNISSYNLTCYNSSSSISLSYYNASVYNSYFSTLQFLNWSQYNDFEIFDFNCHASAKDTANNAANMAFILTKLAMASPYLILYNTTNSTLYYFNDSIYAKAACFDADGLNFSINIFNPYNILVGTKINNTFSADSISNISLGLNSTSLDIGTYRIIYNCSSISAYNTLFMNFRLEEPPKTPYSDLISIGTCYLTTTSGILMFIFFFALAFAFMIVGKWFRNGLVGFFGAFILLFDALYIFSCIAIIAFTIAMLSFLLMWYFISIGLKGGL